MVSPFVGSSLEAGSVKWAHVSSVSSSPFSAVRSSSDAMRHLARTWVFMLVDVGSWLEPHQSPIRIKASPIGCVLRSIAPGTCVPQKTVSTRRLSMPKAHKSYGLPGKQWSFPAPTPSWLSVEATQGLPAAGEKPGCKRGQSNLVVMNQPLFQLTPASLFKQRPASRQTAQHPA